MANNFSTQYVIAVTLENLQALKDLRAELAALRAEASTPIDYHINVSTAKGTGRATSMASGTEKITVDATKFEAAADKIVHAMEALSRDLPRTVAAAATGQSTAGATRTTTQPMSAGRRTQLQREQAALADLPTGVGKPIEQITELDVEKLTSTLRKHAKALGGKFQEEFDLHIRRTTEAAAAAMRGGFADSGTVGKGAGKRDAEGNVSYAREGITSDVSGRMDDIAASNLAKLKGMFKQSQKLIQERYGVLDQQLAAGLEERVETISMGTSAIGSSIGMSFGGENLNRKILATMRLASRGLNKSIELLASRMSEAVSLKLDALAASMANINVNAMFSGVEGGVAGMPGLAGATGTPGDFGGAAVSQRAFGGLRQRGRRSTAEQRASQSAKRFARREAALTTAYERMPQAEREQFAAQADLGRVYFDRPEELGVPASLGGRKGVQGAVAYMLRQGAGQLATRAGTMSEHLGPPMPSARTATDLADRLGGRIPRNYTPRSGTTGSTHFGDEWRATDVTSQAMLKPGSVQGVLDRFAEARRMGRLYRERGEFGLAKTSREDASRALAEFRELQEIGRAQIAMHGGLPPEVTGRLFGARGPRPWDPTLDEEAGRARGVSPKRARAMAASMLRQADEFDKLASTGGVGSGVVLGVGQAGHFADRLGSAAALLRNMQTGQKEFGKTDPRLTAKLARMQQDPFLQYMLPEKITPGNIGEVIDDLSAKQEMFRDKADMARMVTLHKRHGTPGHFDSQGSIVGAKDMAFQPYPEAIKAQLLERISLLGKRQFERTPQIKDAADAVMAGFTPEQKQRLAEAGALDKEREGARLAALSPEERGEEDRKRLEAITASKRRPHVPGSERKNRPAQAFFDKNQMSYYADKLSAMYMHGGEEYSGQFTDFHQLNATLESMGIPPIVAQRAAAAAAGGGGGGGVGGQSMSGLAQELAQARAEHAAIPRRRAGDAGGPGGGGPPGGPPGGFGFGDMDPDKAERVVAALKQLESVRLTGLATDLKVIATELAAIATNPTATSVLTNAAERSNIVLRAQKRMETQGGTLMDLRGTQAQRQADRKELLAMRGASRLGGAMAMATAELPVAGPDAGLNLVQLAQVFTKQEAALGTAQRNYSHLVDKHGITGAFGPQITTATSDIDARRIGMMRTLQSAGKLSGGAAWYNSGGPNSIAAMTQQYQATQGSRLLDEQQLAMGPRVPEHMRAQHEGPMIESIIKGRKAEDEWTKAILTRSSAQMHALASAEHHLTFVDRLTGKIKTLSAYAGAGMLIYGAAAVLKNAFMGAVEFEREMARIQGIVGNRTPAERDQIAAGVLKAARDFGAPVSAVAQTAKTFAQTGIGVPRSIEMTRASLSGQLGAGLEPQQATEMLIAVDNITKGMVSASNILDRISRVEARFPVTAQDLSVGIQRAGSIATQLQPGSYGGTDALDLVMGAVTTIVEKTRVTGNQAGTSLKFIMSRILQPGTANQLQDKFGIKLGGETGAELRPLIDIFHDIAKTYKELLKKGDTGTAAQLLTSVAGARQVNAAAALFGNWDDAMAATNESARAWGDTQQRVNIQMETLGFQIDRTKAAFFTFMNALITQSGLLTGVKGVTKAAGWALGAGGPVAGFMPLITSVVLGRVLGPLAGRAALALAPQLGPALPAVSGAAGFASAATAPILMNLKSLFEVFARTLPVIGRFLGPIGIGLAVLSTGGLIYDYAKKKSRPELWSRTDVGDLRERLKNDQGVKDFGDFAATMGRTPLELQHSVLSAVQDSEQGVVRLRDKQGRLKYPAGTLAGEAYFGGAATKPGLYEDTTDLLVKNLTTRLSSLAAIKDPEARKAKAMQLISQAALIAGGVTEGIRGAELTNIASRSTELASNVAGALSGGVKLGAIPFTSGIGGTAGLGAGYVMGLAKLVAGNMTVGQGAFTQSMKGQNIGGITNKLGDVFGAGLGGKLGGLFLEDKHKTLSQAMLETNASNVGQAFDEVAKSSLELSVTEAELTDKLQKSMKGGSLAANRSGLITILAGLAGTPNAPIGAQDARLKLENQERLVKGFTEEMDKYTPANLLPPELQGKPGSAGAKTVLELFQQAGMEHVAHIQAKAPLEAKAYTKLMETLAKPENRISSFMDIIQRGTEAVPTANARDRILEVIAQYGTQTAVATQAGAAFQRQGVGADIAGARSQAAQEALRGLIAAREQTRWDVVRADSGVVRYDEMIKLAKSSPNFKSYMGADSELSDDERQNTMTAILAGTGKLGSVQKESFANKARFARETVSSMEKDKLFAGMPVESRALITKLAGYSDAQLVGSLDKIIALHEVLVGLTNDEVVNQQKLVAGAQHKGELDAAVLEDNERTATLYRSFGLRQAEMLGGAGGAYGLQMANISASNLAGRGVIQQQYNAAIAIAEAQRKLTGEGPYKAAVDTAETQRQVALTKLGPAERAQAEYAQTFRMDTMQKVLANQQQMVQGMLGGTSNLTSYETLKGRALGPRLYKPALDSFSTKVTSSFFDQLAGPQGVFGKQLGQIFNQPFLMEAQLIRDAHISGIKLGFAGVGMYDGVTDAAGGPVEGRLLRGGTIGAGGSGSSKWKNLGIGAALMAGTLGGGALGTKLGVRNGQNYGSEGAQMGTMVGSLAGTVLPGGPAVWGAIGGMLGGLFGGRSGKNVPPPEFVALERIERNTRETVTAIDNQTKLLTLSDRLVNVPTGFRIPSYSIGGGAGGAVGGLGSVAGDMAANITIHVNGANDPTATADAVTSALREQLFGQGKYTSTRQR